MKLYTKTGDDGSTGLFSGTRVGKDDPRVEAYGTVDELNATIGLAAAACDGSTALHQRFCEVFEHLQSRLFDVGADLATPEQGRNESRITRIDERHAHEVERWIDEIDADNTEMRHFILPGGCDLAARLHVARTVCRRAERRVVHLAHEQSIGAGTLIYLNRVSDLLFAMARRANLEAGVGDVKWTPEQGAAAS
jgi:cob(I)alamin adenosyltransferase